jgi:signal transduction histidine kinase/DNA-binding response OmpR family regulator/PAS domain-containing protein
MLKSFGIKSAFITPIFINNNFWGFVLFEDREEERYFDRDSIEMMRSAAFLCVNTIIRADMEREIEDANEFNRAALKVSPVGFLVIDDQLRFVDCNDTLINMVKPASKQELLDNFALFSPKFQKDGRRSIDVIHDVHRRALEGETLVFEWEHLSSSGELIPCEITLTRTPYKEKYILFAYQYDLRNIKRMENAVLAANEFNQATINAMPIGFYIFDEQYKVIECNDTIPTMFDITKEQFIYNVNNGLFSPEYQPDGVKSSDRVADMLQRAFNGEKPRFEWMHQADGSDKIVTFEINLLRTIYNEKPVVLCFQYNISNIKEMEKSIREQSEMLKSRLEQQELISEISRGFISSGDSETFIKEAIAKLGHYHDVSSVFIFQIDYKKKSAFPAYHWSDDGSPARLVNFDFFSVIKNSFPERLPECATLPVLFTEDIASSSDGTNKPLLQVDVNAFIVAPLYVEGRLWGVVSVEQHFTPRKWTENEKTFVAVTAGTIAGVIMRNIYTTMLKDALDKATMASKAKGEFLSNMSHEMRTPLNAIIGMTAIAKNAVDVERKNYALNKIEDASAHLLGVINDVLDMSKIEANKLELSSVEFSFERMLQKTVTVINFRVEEKHQKLTVHIDRAIPEYLVGDDQRLTQVITNLLGNAVKFTPDKGTISLDARFIKEENGLCTIQVSVADSGIGITKEQKARLFQSFHQAEASTVRKYGGTGLGLAISKNIVTMMGGKIWVESEKDKGSTFYFTIQAKRGEGKTKSLRERSEKWESIRILAVDDDPDILDFFKDISNRYGVYCDTALSGDDALRMVERNGDYNVYFIDWKMPGIDGITLTGALKTIERNTGNSVVIMISAAEWTSIEDEARKAGVEKFLSKPLFPSAVADTICECLGIERHKTDKEKAEVSPDSFKGHRILLVEDVEINREIVLTILEPMGLEIECAENGIQSVDMFRDAPEKYEMIFMDVQMPEMDGYDATRCIRAMEKEWKDTGERSSHVPIVAMTANVFKEDIEKCLDAGMDDHIGKPLDFEVVLEKLNAFLK